MVARSRTAISAFVLCILALVIPSGLQAPDLETRAQALSLVPGLVPVDSIRPNIVPKQQAPRSQPPAASLGEVLFVDLDTAGLRKRLWLGEKKLLSVPAAASKSGWVSVRDSIVFVSYFEYSSVRLFSLHSEDNGETWSAPQPVQNIGWTSKSYPLLTDDFAFLAYHSHLETISTILLRRFRLSNWNLTDSIFVVSDTGGNRRYYGPALARDGTDIWMSYFHYYGSENYMCFRRSANRGITWDLINQHAFVTDGYPQSFMLSDTVFSVVYTRGLDRVAISRSFDECLTWEENQYVADVDNYPSQLPIASSDGVSDIHVVWFDYRDSETGVGGWVFYRFTHDAGETWSQIKSLSLVPASFEVEVWSDTEHVVAVWEDERFGSPNLATYLRYSHDRGQTWSPEIQVVDEVDPAWGAQVSGYGKHLHLVWQEQHPPDWTWGIWYRHGIWYVPGDVNNNGKVNIADVTYLLSYLFGIPTGPPPPFEPSAQVNGSGGINVSDVTYLLSYLFGNGPAPIGEPESLP